MKLTLIDWLVVVAYFALNIGIGLYYRRRATKNTDEYFVGGRKVSWWLAGTSMVATTFAADTPLAVTGLVALYGIAGNWLWWNMLLSSMLTVFFFARLWRRSGVMTDVEFAEIRYAGKPAAFLRGFRAIYLGLPINCIIMAWVNLAMVKILMVIFPDLTIPFLGVFDAKISALVIVFAMMLLTASISVLSGLWGVLVTDMFQFVLKMGMVIVLAVFAVHAVGGIGAMKEQLETVDAAKGGGSVLSFVPEIGSQWMPFISFFTFLAVNWWATWYPGAEPGGGGYVAQRMLSAKDEKNSLLATLWFTIAHYAVRPWPWILAALASLILYPNLKDKESGFVQLIVDPNVFPVALRGLMVAAFAAAYMSTIATQLNWGASYLVNDGYRRFVNKSASEKQYVRVSQIATLLLMIASCFVTYYQNSIADAWKLLIGIGAGTGSVFILRWFWWRINAWSEVSAMLASLVTSLALTYSKAFDPDNPEQFAYATLITVSVSTVVWVAVTFLTKPEPDSVLTSFYRRVRPNATFWTPIAKLAPEVTPVHDGLANGIAWLTGCAMVIGGLFGTGKLIFGDYSECAIYFAIAIVAGGVLYKNLSKRGWSVISEESGEPISSS